jgi:circadian clock protein KaiC
MAGIPDKDDSTLIPTGVEGLDHVLNGGLAPNRMYLIEGVPGSGKTTLALQFLMAGVTRGERCLYVTLSESEAELRATAQSHGWNLEGVRIQEIAASEDSLNLEKRYTMFHPSEVELAETTKTVLALAEQFRPTLLVFDSLSELRLLAENPLRYRRQILALKQHFSRQKCTVLFIDDKTGDHNDKHLHSLAHGVIDLERHAVEYGSIRRQLQVTKLRGQQFREGFHDFAIHRGGVQIFPRLVAAEHRTAFAPEPIKSGLESLDALLGGGIARGTSTLIIGPAGTGKSSLATQYVMAAAARGEHAILFLFDEATSTFQERSKGLGMDLESLIDSNRLIMRQIDPAELSPGEFAFAVRQAVENDKTRIVVIDSLTGYLNALPSERFLILHLHELLTYLGQQGVTTLLLMTQHGMVGDLQAQIDASYLADNVLLLRYFEVRGEVHQAISVIKKRTGKHERTIREFKFERGITIGEPLRDFQGVLSGSPIYTGGSIDRPKGKSERSAD